MTLQQMNIMEKNLAIILKAENGSSDDIGDNKPSTDSTTGAEASTLAYGLTFGAEANTLAYGLTLARMKKECGKESFTQQEMQNPGATILKYTKMKGLDSKNKK